MRIFLFGRMGAGKDEFASYCEERHGAMSYALADGIRGEIRRHNPYYRPKSDRALEIELGQSYRKWFGSDYWCRNVQERIAWTDARFTIIRDGRFAKEYDFFVSERGFTPVEITSRALKRLQRISERDGTYSAELFESKSDCEIEGRPAHRIVNDGTLSDLYTQIDALVDKLRMGAA